MYNVADYYTITKQAFNDPKTGFVGADKFLRRAKEQNPKITMKQVKELPYSKSGNSSVSETEEFEKRAKDSRQGWSLSRGSNVSYAI